MQISRWQADADQQLTLEVSLPEVTLPDMRASLSSDSATIYIVARRFLSHREHLCLPAGARVSHDGSEMLEAAIPVPAIADGQGASITKLRGGLKISVPRQASTRVPAVRSEAIAASHAKAHANTHQDSAALRQTRPQGTSTVDARRSVGQGGTNDHSHLDGPNIGTHQSDASVSANSAFDRARQSPAKGFAASALDRSEAVKLPQLEAPVAEVSPTMTATTKSPPWADIQVEDSEFPWPIKNPDASEGWIDNRGDFQYY